MVVIPYFLFLLFLAFVHWAWKRRDILRLSFRVPGPPSLPFLGDITFSFCYKRNYIKTLRESFDRYPHVFRYWDLEELYIVVLDPSLARVILNAEEFIKKPLRLTKGWKKSIGQGIFTMTIENEDDEDRWRSHRNIINESLDIICTEKFFQKGYFDTGKLKEKLLLRNSSISVELLIFRYVSDRVCFCLFGEKFDFWIGKRDYIYDALISINKSIREDATTVGLSSFMNKNKSKDAHHAALVNLATQLYHTIDRRYMNTETGDLDNSIYLMLNILKAVRIGNMTVNEAIQTVMNIYVKAVGPITSTVCNLLKCLAKDEIRQMLLHEEVYANYVDIPFNVDRRWCGVNMCTYMDFCIEEIHRLYPAGALCFRRTKEDFYFDKLELLIPRDVNFMIPTYLLNRDPRYWDQPDTFMPERWEQRVPSDRADPFGSGPRRCLRRNFSTMLIKMTAIDLLADCNFIQDGRFFEGSGNEVEFFGISGRRSKRIIAVPRLKTN